MLGQLLCVEQFRGLSQCPGGTHITNLKEKGGKGLTLDELVRLCLSEKENSINPSIHVMSWHAQLNRGFKSSILCSVLICLRLELVGSTMFCIFYMLIFFWIVILQYLYACCSNRLGKINHVR